jgi:anti-sigma-K factor RskA
MTDIPESPTDNDIPKPYNWALQRWRLATIACVILLAVAAATMVSMMEQFKAQVSHLQTKLKTTQQIKYVAVLMDDKQLPAMLLSFDLQDAYLQVQRLNDVKEGPEESLQLWALDSEGRALSLGVLSPKLKTAQVPVSDKILLQATGLAISVENKGGVEADRKPSLPYLFTGALIQKAL